MLHVLKRPTAQHQEPLPDNLEGLTARLQALTPRRREIDQRLRELADRSGGVIAEAHLRLGQAKAAEDAWLATAAQSLVRGQLVQTPAEIQKEIEAAELQLRAAQRALPDLEIEYRELLTEQADLVAECGRLERRIAAELCAALFRRHHELLQQSMRIQAAATGLWRWVQTTRDGEATMIANSARELPFEAKVAVDRTNEAVFSDWLAGAADLVADPFHIPSLAEISGRLLSASGDGAAGGAHTARRAGTH